MERLKGLRDQFKKKEAYRSRISQAALLGIILSFGVGFGIFVNASTHQFSNLEDSILESNEHIKFLKSSADHNQRELDVIKRELYKTINAFQNDELPASHSFAAADLEQRTQELNNEYEKAIQSYQHLADTLVRTVQSNSLHRLALEDYNIFSLTTFRIGVVLIVVFFVQILLKIYRHNQEEAKHYHGIVCTLDYIIENPSQGYRISDLIDLTNLFSGNRSESESAQGISLQELATRLGNT